MEDRLPPGQARAKKWPVMGAGRVPTIDLSSFRLDIWGCVERPLSFSWDELRALPQTRVTADMHCVTWWSLLDQAWDGVAFAEVLTRAGVGHEARYVLAHGLDRLPGEHCYTTNVPLEYLTRGDALLATGCHGQPLSAEHGGPLRLVVPQLYAWKSAKWLRGLEFLEADVNGYWERNGYHGRGDPWLEERAESDA